MTLWQIIILASIACVVLKMLGFLVPARVLENPAASRTADLLTVALDRKSTRLNSSHVF